MIYVPLDRVLDSPFQTRTRYDDDAVAALADSIERDGQLQTPAGRIVDKHGVPAGAVDGWRLVSDRTGNYLEHGERERGKHRSFKLDEPASVSALFDPPRPEMAIRDPKWIIQLAYGHTRARAWRLIWARRAGNLVAGAAGIHGVPPGTMPVELRPMSDDQMERLAWTENHARNDLDPVDRAAAIAARVERHGWTHAEAGEALGMARATVSNILRWYQAFKTASSTAWGYAGDTAIAAVRDGRLSEAKARAFAGAFVVAAENWEAYQAVHERFAFEAGPGRILPLSKMAGMAIDAKDAADLRDQLAPWIATVEAEADRQRREREPEMFADEPFTEPAGADAAEAPAFTPEPEANTPEPLAVAEDASAEHVAAEVERINGQHNEAIGWITSPASIQPATTQTLTRTVRELNNLLEQIRTLIARMDADQTIAAGPRVDRLADGIRFDVERCQRELDRRDDADGYDDGGAQLAAVAEAQGLQPFDQADDEKPDPFAKAREEGARAFEEGRNVFDCPYHWKRENAARKAWIGAFESAETAAEPNGSADDLFEAAETDAKERDSANEPWDLFDSAVLDALAGVPTEARRVLVPALSPYLWKRGVTAKRHTIEERWKTLAMEMIRDALIDDHTPETAADALGLEVEWADVSADTPGADVTQSDAASPLRIVLVGCGKQKGDTEAEARDLYTGPLFKKHRRNAEQLLALGQADAWFVLSALHGLLHPADVVKPYDLSMGDLDASGVETWAASVREVYETQSLPGPWPRDVQRDTVVVYAGAAYVEPLQALFPNLEDPHHKKQIGERLALLDREWNDRQQEAKTSGGDGQATETAPEVATG